MSLTTTNQPSTTRYCRLCAKNHETFDLIDAFSINGQSKQIFTKVEQLLQVKITKEDPLPHLICLFCYSKLDEFYQFFTDVTSNQKILTEMFGVSSTENTQLEECSQLPEISGVFITKSISSETNVEEHKILLTTDDTQQDVSLRTTTSPQVSKKRRKRSTHVERFKITYACSECGKEYNSSNSLNQHMDAVHNGVRWKCMVCDREFSYKNDLLVHLNTVHSDRKKLQCEICSASVYDMKKHMLRHEERDLDIRCGDCDKEFSNTECLRNHIRRMHSTDPKQYLCKICAKEFRSSTTLKNHIDSHKEVSQVKKYQCKFCPRTFTNTGNQVKHMTRMHIEEYTEWRKIKSQNQISYE